MCFMFMIMILLLQGYHFPVRAMKLLHPLRPPSNDLPCLFLLKLEAIIQESRNWVLFSHSISRFAMTPWDIFFLSACFLKCKVKIIFFFSLLSRMYLGNVYEVLRKTCSINERYQYYFIFL